MNEPNLFKKLLENRQPQASEQTQVELQAEVPQQQGEPHKRGRPATGKRSDPGWIGRTFYVQKETDLDVEDALLKLKRQGIEVDKSELVDALLDAWLKWQQGENIDLLLGEITPRRKSD